MEFSQLRAFVAASRDHSIARAADRLRLTASPVSRTIRELERQLGGPLLARSYHDLSLTPLGDRVLPWAVELLAEHDQLARVASGAPTPLRIGYTPWAPSRFAQRLTDAATATAGAAGGAAGPVEVRSDLSSVLLHELRHGALDVVVVHLPIDLPGLGSRSAARYRFHILFGAPDPLAAAAELKLADLAGRDVISLPRIMQPNPMEALEERLRRAGVRSVSELDLRDIVTVRSRLRRTGELLLGTLAPDAPLAGMLTAEDLVAVPLADGEIDFHIGLAWRSRDSVNGDRVRSIVERVMLLPDGELELVD